MAESVLLHTPPVSAAHQDETWTPKVVQHSICYKHCRLLQHTDGCTCTRRKGRRFLPLDEGDFHAEESMIPDLPPDPPLSSPTGEQVLSATEVDDVPSDAFLGRRIGDLRLVSCIGEGGFGAVYRPEDQTLGTSFAVKVLHAKHLDKSVMIKRFRSPYHRTIEPPQRDPRDRLWSVRGRQPLPCDGAFGRFSVR